VPSHRCHGTARSNSERSGAGVMFSVRTFAATPLKPSTLPGGTTTAGTKPTRGG
jgi:hypothetical protein